ncbi:hypothetical protein [Anaeromyxobacter paludicola]|uniref:Uncharacterized protein n=1 Tax=Anaeromyxobacter paludicola TaxID=2918171 RepID=A0ABN6N346_9BACT|nr:hypothetical protein [Anaeromyxobacter paludicola]BDG07614.1 hypothetical protein AMPC_07270 [Anaeromyxobacter paludicola]
MTPQTLNRCPYCHQPFAVRRHRRGRARVFCGSAPCALKRKHELRGGARRPGYRRQLCDGCGDHRFPLQLGREGLELCPTCRKSENDSPALPPLQLESRP